MKVSCALPFAIEEVLSEAHISGKVTFVPAGKGNCEIQWCFNGISKAKAGAVKNLWGETKTLWKVGATQLWSFTNATSLHRRVCSVKKSAQLWEHYVWDARPRREILLVHEYSTLRRKKTKKVRKKYKMWLALEGIEVIGVGWWVLSLNFMQC